ncbi:MAG: polysaccharide biosynthesis/export family protein [Gammaproteobacteria bacterium]|nr:polysaccharide biosynthesis/export family protein [Gammaproteobacteria bacterium]
MLVPLLAGLSATAVRADEMQPYRVKAGDQLDISVWREEELTRTVLVRPDGGFSFPLAGEVWAIDKSVQQLQEEISQKLTKYIPEPVVTVSVREVISNRIYVIGKVQRPGVFVVNPNVDVVQALALAGGFSTFAETDEIQILRRNGDQQQSFKFNYRDIEQGENLDQNIKLMSGDIVVVP